MTRAKQAILHGPRDLHIEDIELDTNKLEPHEVWVKTEISAFKIGTDRGNYEGAGYGLNEATYPRAVGDSSVGVIQGVGSDVTRFKIGDRVADRHPHASAHIYDERQHIVKVPDGVNPEDAVWSHLYTLSGFCYRKAQFEPGENVAVVGLGVLGLGAVALGPLFGARVVGLSNSPIRMEMAMKMGAHAAYLSDDPELHTKLDNFTNGIGIDLVILTANPWPAYRTSVQIVRNGGRVSIVSLLGRGEEPLDFNPLVLDWFYNKGISLIAINSERTGYLFPGNNDEPERFSWNNSCDHIISLMANGKLEPRNLITHRLHYSEIHRAYEMANDRQKTMLGVTFDWRDT